MKLNSFYTHYSPALNLAAVYLSAGHEELLKIEGTGTQTAMVSFGIHLGRCLGRIGVVAARFFNLLNPWSENPGYKRVGLLANSTARLIISPLQVAGSALLAIINGVGNIIRSKSLKTFSQQGLQKLAEIDSFFDAIEALFFDTDCKYSDVETAANDARDAVVKLFYISPSTALTA